mmetsp:Transcript_20934/g.27174  ORF Transcript_20934/g.27174 Transcript_20934/m.27174 type:complete len:376 (-) Transcript_20934:207-1334(-)
MMTPLAANDQNISSEKQKDPNEEERKLLHRKMQWHTWRLWITQAMFGLLMFVVAICSDDRYGYAWYYTNRQVGARLLDLQYLWALLTLLSAGCGFYINRLWAVRNWLQINLTLAYKSTKRYVYLTGFGLLISTWGTVALFVGFEGLKLDSGYSTSLKLFQLLDLLCFVVGGFYMFLRFLSLTIYTKKFKKWADWNGVWDDDVANRVVPLEGNFASLEDMEKGTNQVEVHQQVPNAPPHPAAVEMSPTKSQMKETPPMNAVLFEQLWTDLPTAGSFTCQIAEAVSEDVLNAHFVDKGFEIVASGTVRDEMKTYLAVKKEKSTKDGYAWFIAQMVASKSFLTLTATFKCQDEALVRECVQKFNLNQVFQLIQPERNS